MSLDAFWAAPPVSRTLTAAVFVVSVVVYGGLLNAHRIIFTWPFITKFPPEVWRFFTSFLLSGPQLGIIFDPYFIWQYASSLETNSPRFTNPGDFFAYIIFVGAVILVMARQFLGAVIYTSALIIAIAYTYAQDNRGKKIKFFFITIDVKWLPYAMLLLNFVVNGMPSTQVQAMGIPAAHLYDFLTRLWPAFGGGRNILPTPTFVSRWFESESRADRIVVKKHVTVYRPLPATTSSYTGGWGSRGEGRRLGGE
ncbi:hypothetical protein MMC30_005505 [Trapelia coarctata]|nr:hypothetical protein [Trapelia coarctata]